QGRMPVLPPLRAEAAEGGGGNRRDHLPRQQRGGIRPGKHRRVPESLQHSDGAGVHLPQRRHLAGQVRLVHAGGGNPGVHQPVTNRRRPEMRCDMKDMNDMRIGNRIEELSLNHWPALVTMARGGWLLRFADGYTKRANSVSAIYGEEGGEEELEERIAWCERRFAELG